jgi:hypothetical protein
LWSISATALAMIVTSLIRGWATRYETAGLTAFSARQQRTLRVAALAGTWLERSQQQAPTPSTLSTHDKPHPYQNPLVWSILVLTALAVLNLVVFW